MPGERGAQQASREERLASGSQAGGSGRSEGQPAPALREKCARVLQHCKEVYQNAVQLLDRAKSEEQDAKATVERAKATMKQQLTSKEGQREEWIRVGVAKNCKRPQSFSALFLEAHQSGQGASSLWIENVEDKRRLPLDAHALFAAHRVQEAAGMAAARAHNKAKEAEHKVSEIQAVMRLAVSSSKACRLQQDGVTDSREWSTRFGAVKQACSDADLTPSPCLDGLLQDLSMLQRLGQDFKGDLSRRCWHHECGAGAQQAPSSKLQLAWLLDSGQLCPTDLVWRGDRGAALPVTEALALDEAAELNQEATTQKAVSLLCGKLANRSRPDLQHLLASRVEHVCSNRQRHGKPTTAATPLEVAEPPLERDAQKPTKAPHSSRETPKEPSQAMAAAAARPDNSKIGSPDPEEAQAATGAVGREEGLQQTAATQPVRRARERKPAGGRKANGRSKLSADVKKLKAQLNSMHSKMHELTAKLKPGKANARRRAPKAKERKAKDSSIEARTPDREEQLADMSLKRNSGHSSPVEARADRKRRSELELDVPDWEDCARARPLKVHREAKAQALRAAMERQQKEVASAAATLPVQQGRANDRAHRLALRQQAKAGVLPEDYAWAQLKARTKKLKFRRSAVHAWGLFAEEAIAAEDFIIEYVGEVIPSSLEDARERQYEAAGLDSSYLFRIDREYVIDATKKGGLARYVNHSCDPNCYTKVMTMEGTKHVVIFSKRAIAPGEELCYDYNFAYEEDKEPVPCHCGAKNCCGRLN